ncbi:hypothetical protein RN001_011298 [Aquatica leii]|uniref:Peptidase S1 domain-containing protein n=1 Tax=Aquatica leii TaxID=1421715 RepID=A0AAN7SEY3_9COLE|nr:hypothetical protein RN001_011298 [Aquatica leii]
MKLCTLILVSFVILGCNAGPLETSPCPRLFVYEDTTTYPDRWYGIMTLLSDSDLTGTWIRIIFDKPILQLGNWYGEVVKRSPVDYLIKNPTYNLKAHTPKVVRFFVRYNPNTTPPKLQGFRLNAKVMCPEDLVTTTPTTTTEHLFTSKDESALVTDGTIQEVTTAASNQPNLISTDDATPKPFTSEHHSLFLSHHTEPDTEACGVTNFSPKENLSQQVAQPGEYPWHVALYYTKDITIAYLCGASLISKQHLITVAHCVVKGSTQRAVNSDRLVAYLGKYYLKHWAHEGTQTRYISHVIPHPDYKPSTNRNDIALIKMYKPAIFTDVVRPVCLWNNNLKDKVGTVIGWGFDESGKIEEKLMHVEMTVQTDDICNTSITNYTSRFGNEKAYCANFIDDTIECVGDSGGGMVFRTSEDSGSVWHLKGLISVSVVLQKQLKCGPQQFVVFTDVSKYEEWIKEMMLL